MVPGSALERRAAGDEPPAPALRVVAESPVVAAATAAPQAPPAAPAAPRISRRLTNNLTWNVASEAAGRGASLWLSFWIARAVSVEDFGRFAFSLAAVQYAWLAVDAAANGGYAAREVAKLRGLGDARGPALAGLFLRARVLAGLVLTPLAAAVVALAPLPAESKRALTGALPYFIVSASFADWALRGTEDFRGLALANLLGAATLVTGTLVLLPQWPSASTATAIWALSLLAPAGVAFVRLHRAGALAAPAAGLPWRPHARRSTLFAAGAAASIGCVQLPLLIVGAFASPAEAGHFSAAYRLVLAVVGVASMVCWPLLPVLASTPPGSAEFRRAIRFGGALALALAGSAAAVLAIAPARVLAAAFGEAYVPGADALRIAALALPAVAVTALLDQVCLGIGGERSRVFVFGTALAVLVAAAFALVPRFGSVGASASLLAAFVTAAGGYAIVLRSVLPLPALPGSPRRSARANGADLRGHLAARPPLPGTPFVSVLLAVRNEENHIERTLAAVRQLEWPRDRLEILLVDGDSTDRTRAIAMRVAAGDPRVRLLSNPARCVAQGLNVGLAAARGDVLVRVDGHCRVPPGYVRAGVDELRRGNAECAGGPVRARGEGAIARAIALAMSSPFGVGGAAFRWARHEREVDHLPFGVWRREVFEFLGGFDESLVRNQDDEFSDRLRRAGGRIRLLPGQVVDYWSRPALGGLWRQYFGYGFWKVRVIRKRGGWPSSPRHLAPAALLASLPGGALIGAATGWWALAAVVPAAYAAFLACATLATWASRRDRTALLLPAVLPVLHAAYGAGFLRALFAPVPAAGPSVPAIAPAGTGDARAA